MGEASGKQRTSSFCWSLSWLSCRPMISVPMCEERSTTLAAAEKSAFFSGSARFPGSSCLRPSLRTEVASLMFEGFSVR